MVALVDHEMSVIGDDVVDFALANQALDDADIDDAARLAPAAADLPDRGGREIEKRREPRDPLFHELTAVDEHQRVGSAGGDDGRGDDCLAEPGRRREHAGLVRQQCIGGGLLFRGQASEKRGFNRTAGIALVAHVQGDAQVFQQSCHRLAAAARQGDVVRQQLGAGDDARGTEGGAPHRLGAIEGRVLEGGEPDEPVDEARAAAPGARDVELVAQHRADALGQRTGHRGQAAGAATAARSRARRPRRRAAGAARRRGPAGRPRRRSARAAVALRTRRRMAGEKRPLVGPWGSKSVVEEDGVAALPSGPPCRGRAMRLPKPPGRQRCPGSGRSGRRSANPISGIALHGLGEQVGAEAAGEWRRARARRRRSRHARRCPSASARAPRARPSRGRRRDRRPRRAANVALSKSAARNRQVSSGQHGIDAEGVAAAQMLARPPRR